MFQLKKNNSTSINCYSSRVKEFIRFKIQSIYRVYNIIAIKILLLHLEGQYYSTPTETNMRKELYIPESGSHMKADEFPHC